MSFIQETTKHSTVYSDHRALLTNKKEQTTHTTRMNFKYTLLSEKSKSQKAINYMIPLISHYKKCKTIEMRTD